MHGAEQAADDEARQHLGRGDAGVHQEPAHLPHPHRFLRHRRQRRDDEAAECASSPGPHSQAARNTTSSARLARRAAARQRAFVTPRSCRHPRLGADAELVHQPVDVAGDLRVHAAASSGSSRPGMSIAISSMMRPGRRLITSTRSDRVTASSRSWVISSAVLPARFKRLRQLALQHHAGLRVDRRERLVEQQHRRIDRERARQRHALPHAAGQLMRIVVGEFRELEVFQERLRAPLAARPRARPGFRRRTSRSRRPSATAAAGPSAA